MLTSTLGAFGVIFGTIAVLQFTPRESLASWVERTNPADFVVLSERDCTGVYSLVSVGPDGSLLTATAHDGRRTGVFSSEFRVESEAGENMVSIEAAKRRTSWDKFGIYEFAVNNPTSIALWPNETVAPGSDAIAIKFSINTLDRDHWFGPAYTERVQDSVRIPVSAIPPDRRIH